MVSGLILNSIVIIVWYHDEKKFRTSSSLFLFHMTIADLLISSFIPLSIWPNLIGINVIKKRYPRGI